MVTDNCLEAVDDVDVSDSFRHDRYAIYRMLGREISFVPQRSTRKISGVTERVCRDIFDNVVEITVNGKIFRFKEPTLIAMHGDRIVFVYGKTSACEQDDDALFGEMQERFGETIDDVMRRMTPSQAKTLWFAVGRPVDSHVWRRDF